MTIPEALRAGARRMCERGAEPSSAIPMETPDHAWMLWRSFSERKQATRDVTVLGLCLLADIVEGIE